MSVAARKYQYIKARTTIVADQSVRASVDLPDGTSSIGVVFTPPVELRVGRRRNACVCQLVSSSGKGGSLWKQLIALLDTQSDGAGTIETPKMEICILQ